MTGLLNTAGWSFLLRFDWKRQHSLGSLDVVNEVTTSTLLAGWGVDVRFVRRVPHHSDLCPGQLGQPASHTSFKPARHPPTHTSALSQPKELLESKPIRKVVQQCMSTLPEHAIQLCLLKQEHAVAGSRASCRGRVLSVGSPPAVAACLP